MSTLRNRSSASAPLVSAKPDCQRRQGSDDVSSAEIEALYPFLYGQKTDRDSLLQQVAESARAKACDIADLRKSLAARVVDELADCAEAMARAFRAGGKLLCFGNGGSSTDAQAVAQTFSRPISGCALPALSLTSDIAVITALGNDVGFDSIFSRQLAGLGQAPDIALGISTSGNSSNVLNAFAQARRLDLMTIGLTGYSGGRMAECGDITFLFIVPSASVHRIQEAQSTIYHLLWKLTQVYLHHSAEHHRS